MEDVVVGGGNNVVDSYTLVTGHRAKNPPWMRAGWRWTQAKKSLDHRERGNGIGWRRGRSDN